MFVHYDEYFDDDVEKLVKQIDEFCEANDAKADGYLEVVTADIDNIAGNESYSWKNSKDYEYYEGYYWLAHQCEDDVLIWELKRRGYESVVFFNIRKETENGVTFDLEPEIS